MTKPASFKYFKISPDIIRLAVMLYIRFSLPLRNVEDLLHERGINVSHETVRYWWNRFGSSSDVVAQHSAASHGSFFAHRAFRVSGELNGGFPQDQTSIKIIALTATRMKSSLGKIRALVNDAMHTVYQSILKLLFSLCRYDTIARPVSVVFRLTHNWTVLDRIANRFGDFLIRSLVDQWLGVIDVTLNEFSRYPAFRTLADQPFFTLDRRFREHCVNFEAFCTWERL